MTAPYRDVREILRGYGSEGKIKDGLVILTLLVDEEF